VSAAQWWIVVAAFLGGAVPWLEAIVVVPIGILAGGPPVLVVLAALIGNLITVWLFAVFGQRARLWWIGRRKRRMERSGKGPDPRAQAKKHRRADRIDRVMKRFGLPGLAVLGPLGLGTQLSALAAVAMGVSSRAAFAWVGAGTVGWAIVAGVLTVTGASFLGIGA